MTFKAFITNHKKLLIAISILILLVLTISFVLKHNLNKRLKNCSYGIYGLSYFSRNNSENVNSRYNSAKADISFCEKFKFLLNKEQKEELTLYDTYLKKFDRFETKETIKECDLLMEYIKENTVYIDKILSFYGKEKSNDEVFKTIKNYRESQHKIIYQLSSILNIPSEQIVIEEFDSILEYIETVEAEPKSTYKINISLDAVEEISISVAGGNLFDEPENQSNDRFAVTPIEKFIKKSKEGINPYKTSSISNLIQSLCYETGKDMLPDLEKYFYKYNFYNNY